MESKLTNLDIARALRERRRALVKKVPMSNIFHDSRRSRSARTTACAFTLPELIVSMAIFTLLLLGGSSFYIFSLSSFAAITNYTELNKQTRAASDMITRDVRGALNVASATTNQLVLAASDNTNVTYNFSSSLGTLTRTKGGDVR